MKGAFAKAFGALASLTIAIAAGALCALVLVLTWQVIGRYVLNDSPSWTEPVALTLMSISALFGAAIAVRRESHFAFPTLIESAPPLVRQILKIFSRLVAIVFGMALSAFGFFLVQDAWDIPMAGAPLPEGVSYIGVAVGGALIAAFAAERLFAGDFVEPQEAA